MEADIRSISIDRVRISVERKREGEFEKLLRNLLDIHNCVRNGLQRPWIRIDVYCNLSIKVRDLRERVKIMA